MKEDFSELVEYLDEKFRETKNEFEDLRGDFRTLQTSVDAYAHKADGFFQERVMLAHKTDRMEKWIKQIADKVGIKLEF